MTEIYYTINAKSYFWEKKIVFIIDKKQTEIGPGEGLKNGIPVKTGKIPCL